MITASLLINIFVLMPVCAIIFLRLEKSVFVFGPDGTARQILLCIYLTILAISVAILLFPNQMSSYLVPLFTMQIIYKLLSVVLIQNKKTPVLWFNLAIALFHSATLYSIQ